MAGELILIVRHGFDFAFISFRDNFRNGAWLNVFFWMICNKLLMSMFGSA